MSKSGHESEEEQTMIQLPIDPDKMKVVNIKAELKSRKLKINGRKEDLVNRLKAALLLEDAHDDDDEQNGGEGKNEQNDDEEKDGKDDDEMKEQDEEKNGGCDDEEKNEEHDYSDDDSSCRGSGNNASRQHQQMFSIRDVEDSMETFSGDDSLNIRRWLSDFEEMALLCGWSDIQKVIFAKKTLRGSARLFVQYERCAKTWKQLKKALQGEFSKTVNSHTVHKELTLKKKTNTETYNEYIYRMCELASQANIEIAAVIQYIIDGIQDDETNKVVLYGAKTVRELKDRFVQYERIKENMKRKAQSLNSKEKKQCTRIQAGNGITTASK